MITQFNKYNIILRNRKCMEAYKGQGHILAQDTHWDNEALFHIHDSTIIRSTFKRDALWGAKNIELVDITTGSEALSEARDIYALGGHFKSMHIPISGLMITQEIGQINVGWGGHTPHCTVYAVNHPKNKLIKTINKKQLTQLKEIALHYKGNLKESLEYAIKELDI